MMNLGWSNAAVGAAKFILVSKLVHRRRRG
jgi:hypothetical protein